MISPDPTVYTIIRRALKNKPENTINHEDLLKTASEFGLDEKDIERAIREEERLNDDEVLKEEWLRKGKSNFKSHLITYCIMMTFLFLINMFSGGGWWFQWALIGWGIGIAFHFKSTFLENGMSSIPTFSKPVIKPSDIIIPSDSEILMLSEKMILS